MKKFDCIKRELCLKLYFCPRLDKKFFRIKKSFDEVNKICGKKKK